MKEFQDILDDFTLEQRMAYEEYTGTPLAKLAEEHGDTWVYDDLTDFCLK